MAEIETAVVNIMVKMSLWQAIKLRISGILKNAEYFKQDGNYISIKYKADSCISSHTKVKPHLYL